MGKIGALQVRVTGRWHAIPSHAKIQPTLMWPSTGSSSTPRSKVDVEKSAVVQRMLDPTVDKVMTG